MVACGSYDGTVGLYTDAGSFKPYFLIPKMHRRSGVTQVMFSPCGGFLYTGGRKDGKIHCWKMRAGSGAKPLYSLARPQVKKTNQTIAFDIHPHGGHLYTGDGNSVCCFDLKQGKRLDTFQAASDAVNGVSLNPNWPMLATASGERKFGNQFDSSSDSDEGGPSPDARCLKLWSVSQQP
mmetsp:Transcript_14094/g.35464  ORF Transcript_14094/g.35464 Transcript_14094/m.35464 type:complete len:179 (+) Transcript_14094:945-1481(+)